MTPRLTALALPALSSLCLLPASGQTCSFGAGQTITAAGGVSFTSVFATDLDGDGDSDVLSTSSGDFRIAWYENQGGGVFGPQQVIGASVVSSGQVYATDLDGDGDADVLAGFNNSNVIGWYENRGGGVFVPGPAIPGAEFAESVFATDLDGDGDADLLSTKGAADEVAWYENVGGGIFGSRQSITTSAERARSVYAVDLDGDGDADVISASRGDDKIAWYENLGGGTFGAQQVIAADADGAFTAYAADLDGDGDADVLSGSLYGVAEVAWYENRSSAVVGLNYCAAHPNSTGAAGELRACGSTALSDNQLRISALSLPPFVSGILLASRTQGLTPNPAGSLGTLCLAGGIGRFTRPGEVQFTGSAAVFSLDLDLDRIPQPGGPVAVQPGESWNFTAWYRDTDAGAPVSNFTDGLEITFQ